MNALLTLIALLVGLCVAVFVPTYGASAVLVCTFAALIAGFAVRRIEVDRTFLFYIFVSGLLVRMIVGTLIFSFKLQDFFGGDAMAYDQLGTWMWKSWQGDPYYKNPLQGYESVGWGMAYLVGSIYATIGRNLLAVQLVNSVIGAATAPLAYLCAQQMFQNTRVSRVTALFVAFFPSLVLWTSQGLKDGPIIFCLVAAMLATMRLGEQLSPKFFLVLVGSLLGLLSLRFYVFYMAIAASGGAFLIGMRRVTGQSLARQFIVLIAVGLAMTYFGVLRRASQQFETFGNLERVQRSRADLASVESGFGRDVDVSTASGAIQTIPLGMVYLLFAPFPWQLANLRQSITLPEMFVWWASFPLLVMGIWFTLKYRMRQALPILIFTTMLTLAYSIFQGNVGTAYRQRSQLLVFYFIFVSVGAVLLKERSEERARLSRMKKEALLRTAQERQARRRYEQWRRERDREWADIARGLSERIDN
ncbi:MAG TPA: glycosyltransferase family 39 protein [Pyrinomonadaceae bacterium]|nr:glycosyltransferase family 39 protein [Pyrinomonadaceae bacterium]